MAGRQASRVRPGWIGRHVDGRQVHRLDHAVGVGRGDQGHRRPAPRAGAIVEDPPAPAALAPGHQAPEPGARRRTPGSPASIARPNSTRPERQRRSRRAARDRQPAPAGGAAGTQIKAGIADLERQAAWVISVQEPRDRRPARSGRTGGTRPRRASPRSPSRSTSASPWSLARPAMP